MADLHLNKNPSHRKACPLNYSNPNTKGQIYEILVYSLISREIKLWRYLSINFYFEELCPQIGCFVKHYSNKILS